MGESDRVNEVKDFDENSHPWKTISRQKKKGSSSIVTSFFVGSLLASCTKSDLLNSFRKFGNIFNVYIAKKKDRFGSIFGFVSYIVVQDAVELESKLHDIKISNLKLDVNISLYNRNEEPHPIST